MVVVLKYVMVDADRYCRDQGVVVVDESDSDRILRHRTKVWCGGYIPGRGLWVARVLLVPVLLARTACSGYHHATMDVVVDLVMCVCGDARRHGRVIILILIVFLIMILLRYYGTTGSCTVPASFLHPTRSCVVCGVWSNYKSWVVMIVVALIIIILYSHILWLALLSFTSWVLLKYEKEYRYGAAAAAMVGTYSSRSIDL